MAALTKAGFEIVPKDNPAAAAVNSLETMPVKVVVFEEPDDVSEGPTLAPRTSTPCQAAAGPQS